MKDLMRWEPLYGLSQIQARINDLFEDSFGRPRTYSNATSGVWFPPADALESRESYLIPHSRGVSGNEKARFQPRGKGADPDPDWGTEV